MLFNRLGLSPPNKFLLCHLAARTVEETHEVTLNKVIDLLEATPTTWSAPRLWSSRLREPQRPATHRESIVMVAAELWMAFPYPPRYPGRRCFTHAEG